MRYSDKVFDGNDLDHRVGSVTEGIALVYGVGESAYGPETGGVGMGIPDMDAFLITPPTEVVDHPFLSITAASIVACRTTRRILRCRLGCWTVDAYGAPIDDVSYSRIALNNPGHTVEIGLPGLVLVSGIPDFQEERIDCR